MKKINKKAIVLVFLIFILGMSLTGCYDKEYEAAETKAIKMALTHIKEKYGINTNESMIKDTNVDSQIGYGVAAPPSGTVIVSFKDGYTVYVNLNKDTAYDDMQIPKLKEDIKARFIDEKKFLQKYYIRSFEVSQTTPYIFAQATPTGQYLDKNTHYDGDLNKLFKNTGNRISLTLDIYWKSENDNNLYVDENKEFVNSFNDNFMGEITEINSVVYKKDRYMSQDIRKIIEKQEGGSWSSKDYNIYSFMNILNHTSSEYRYASPEKIKDYDEDWKSKYNHWEHSIVYPNFITLEPGLQVASPESNIVFHSANDLFYQKVEPGQRHDETFDKIMKAGLSSPSNPYLNSKDGRKIEIESNLYFVSFTPEDIKKYDMNWNEGVIIKIDKNIFLNGKLKKGFKIIMPWPSSSQNLSLDEPKESVQYFEDENTLYFYKENRKAFAVAKDY